MSRYANTPRTWVPHPDKGWLRVTFRGPNYWQNQAYSNYQVSSADDMLSLAYRNYGDATMYWGIAEMNPGVLCPDDLKAGEVLQLPAGPR